MSQIPARFDREIELWFSGLKYVAGVDEVGRGAWAGPVVAAAVIFPKNIYFPEELFDSKLLKARQREKLSVLINKHAISVGVGTIGLPVINKFGIGKATHKAFRAALTKLSVNPEKILVDAFYVKHLDRKRQDPVKNGDRVCATIAAASIIAKVHRDSIMRKLSREFPVYGFGLNKGYGTAYHQEAIRKNNFCIMHRKSFNLSHLVQ
jgi:ribonuclease HII